MKSQCIWKRKWGILDSRSRQIAIYSGYAKEMMPESWKLADRRTYVHWAEKKYDILVFGMPQKFHYGDGMGTNPIMMMQQTGDERSLCHHLLFFMQWFLQ